MGDIVPGVPWRWVESPNHGGPRTTTLGVVIHSTRGGQVSLEAEYQATVRYCSGPNASDVGPHFVIGPAEVTRMVHDDIINWAQTVDNDTHLGIEVAQPYPTTPFTTWQYQATADIVARLSLAFGFPAEYIGRQTTTNVEVPGILGHDDTRAGWSRGKTDPGDLWDWQGFMALVKAKVRELSAPVLPVDIVAYLTAHPLLGAARMGPNLTYQDGALDWVVKCTSGAVVFRRNWTGQIGHIDWQPETVPVDKAAVQIELDKATAAIAEAKRLVG